ncbi:MAG: hypothetical protein ABI835_05735 [Chloroflexota bacterium]
MPKPFNALTLCAALVLLGAACTSGVTPTPASTPLPPTPTSRLSTHEGPLVFATLPPSWTPTFTPSPTATLTPTPVTPTATATAVTSLDDLCDTFTVDYAFADGRTFFWGDTIAMTFGTPLTIVRDPATHALVPLLVRFLATHVESGENLGAQTEGGQVAGMELDASRLVTPGYYTWKVSVYIAGIGERCVHEGNFYVYPSALDLTPTAEVTSDA